MRKLTPILSLGLQATSLYLVAQEAPPGSIPRENDPGELLKLLNTKVTVASKKEESTADAAASVTAYSASLIEALGTYTLGDLAEITPGYSTYYIYGERVFETRGQKAGSFNNNRHLLLVDGIPVAHARNFKVPTEEELPLQFADRVEFLRGPASSLYGIGAFYGVVSITPKASPNGTRVDIQTGAGGADRAKRVMATITHGSESSETLLAVSYFSKKDSDAFVGTADNPLNLYRDGRTSLFMTLSHKLKEGPFAGLSLGTLFTYKTGNLGELWNNSNYTSAVDQLAWGMFIPYLKYERRLSNTLSFNGYLKYNESEEKGGASPFSTTTAGNFNGTGTVYSVYAITVADYEGLAELQWTPDPSLDVIAGVNLDNRWQKSPADGGYNINVQADPGPPYAELPVKKTEDYRTASAYLQAKKRFPLLAGMSVVAGLRLDRGTAPGNTYSQLSPRLGLVQKVTEAFNLKASYGTALRGPGIKEVEYNTEKKTVDPSLPVAPLGAETFRTLEVAATYVGQGLSTSLTWFTNRTTDTLDPDPAHKNIFFNNPGTTKASGLEGELHFLSLTGWHGWLNASLAKATSPQQKEVVDVPVSTGSAGVARTLLTPIHVKFAAVIRYLGAFRVANPALSQPKGGTFLDLRVGLPPSHGLGASLEVRNLTNKIIKYPKSGLPDVPSSGRSLLLNAWIRF